MTHQALITGANRGIGLALVREYVARDWRVIAACRVPEQAATLIEAAENTRGKLSIKRLDVTNPREIADLVHAIADVPIDVLVNNAGVFDEDCRLGSLDYDAWRHIIEVNLLGQVRVTEALIGNVLASEQKKVVAISSALGAISHSTGGRYAYRSSKAALNMVFRSLAQDLRQTGAIVALLSPGLVDTDLTRAVMKPKISVEECARGLADVISGLTPADSGAFLRYNGDAVAW